MEFPLVQPFQIHTPSSILIVGPSGCGKTVFTHKLLENNLDLFETYPQSIHYCYGAWQPKFKEMKFAQFHEGIPELEELDQWFPKGKGILVMDDLMDEGSHDKRVLDLFTKHSHHRDITVLYLCQDMFPAGKYAKSISRNAHYVIAFKNPRDQLGVRNLLLQSFPTCWKECLETYQACTQEPFGYMWLDLHPASGDEERVLSHVLKDQGWTRSYQKPLGTPWTVAKKAAPSYSDTLRTQQGEGIPWLVDVKKGFEVTSDLVKALKKPQMSAAQGRKMVSGYKEQYQAYKRRGGTKGYNSWLIDKGYAKKPNKCCIQ